MNAAHLLRAAQVRQGLTQADVAARGYEPASDLRLRARSPRPDDRHAATADRSRRRAARASVGCGAARLPSCARPRSACSSTGRRLAAGRRHPCSPAPRPEHAEARVPAVKGLSLPDKIIAIDITLAGVPHAFGGALASPTGPSRVPPSTSTSTSSSLRTNRLRCWTRSQRSAPMSREAPTRSRTMARRGSSGETPRSICSSRTTCSTSPPRQEPSRSRLPTAHTGALARPPRGLQGHLRPPEGLDRHRRDDRRRHLDHGR